MFRCSPFSVFISRCFFIGVTDHVARRHKTTAKIIALRVAVNIFCSHFEVFKAKIFVVFYNNCGTFQIIRF